RTSARERLPGLGGVFDAPRAALVDSAELLTEGSGLGESKQPPVTHVSGQSFAARRSGSQQQQQQRDETVETRPEDQKKQNKLAHFVIGNDNFGYNDVGDYYENENTFDDDDWEAAESAVEQQSSNQQPTLPYNLVSDGPDGSGRAMVLHLGETELIGESLKRELTDMLEFAEEELECRRVLLGISRRRQDKDTLMRTLPFLGFACYEPRSGCADHLTCLDTDGFAYMAYAISD
uniref:Ornithine decarboxylase antizyme n=2 Tax=Macrostomum lignano TaxID=282301 RepID=A0A1I8HZZ7_9PLAT